MFGLLTLLLKGLKSRYWEQNSSCDWLIWRLLMQFLLIVAKIINWKFVLSGSNFSKPHNQCVRNLGTDTDF